RRHLRHHSAHRGSVAETAGEFGENLHRNRREGFIASVLEVPQALGDHWYTSIVPPIGQGAPLQKWAKNENHTTAGAQSGAKNWPRATNTGILTRLTPTIDIDILSEPAAIAAEELIRERFEDRGYVLTRVGRPPKRAVPFRTLQPFAKLTTNFAVLGDAEKL